MKSVRIFNLFLVIGVLGLSSSQALLNNNVRIKKFKWMVAQTEHFDIYYDKESEALAPRMAHYLEKAWRDVGGKLNYQVSERTPFFFYSNHNNFEQTNIVPIGEGTGGVTEAFKNRFVIFNDGSETWMKHVIYHEFGHVVQFNVLYGGFWKSIRLLKSPFYPLWVMEGMAEWVSDPTDYPSGEMIIRDAVYHDTLIPLEELQGFNHLKPNQVTLAYKTGDMAIHFLAEEYGEKKVGELLSILENYFDISSALNELLGTDLRRFDFRFQEWLKDRFREFYKTAKTPDMYGEKFSESDGLPQFSESPVFSADGRRVYFFSDRKGMTDLYVHDQNSGKTKSLLGRRWRKFENIHTKGRSLSLSPDGRFLAFAGEKKQRDFLYFLDTAKRKLKKIKLPFKQVRSPVFSPEGDDLVVVGMKNGYNDLYLIDSEGQILKRLTNSPQDESNPVFSPDGGKIVFSGEVLIENGEDPAGRDLFELSLTDLSIKRLTDYEGAEDEPAFTPEGNLLFTRELDDLSKPDFNLWALTPDGEDPIRLTKLVGGAFSPRWNDGQGRLFYVAHNAGERFIYSLENPENPLPTKKENVSSVIPERSGAWDDDFLTLGPRIKDKTQPGVTQARLSWGEGSNENPLLASANPYKFKASTDLFIPFLYYSTVDGLVGANIWQFSDYLGNHQFQEAMQYGSKDDFIDLSLFYTYARFRPRLTLGFRNQRYFRDINKVRLRRRTDGIAVLNYPLDRVNSLSAGVGATDEKDSFLDDSEEEIFNRERFWVTGFTHDTVTGRYLVPVEGRRLSVFYQEGVNQYNSNREYKTGGAEAVQYVRLPRESTLASRVFYGRSTGEDPQVFRLGGVDRVRGVSRGSFDNKKHNAVVGSVEARIRLTYLHARTRFLFPDFFFKGAYLILFDDVGYGWDNSTERDEFTLSEASNSAGAGLSWPTFILQSFQLNMTIQWARRTDEGEDVWYFTLGPTF